MIDELCGEFSKQLGLAPEQIFAEGVTFKDVLALSPTATNSIDIVEAIAVALAKYDLEDAIEVPALTLDDETMGLHAHLSAHLPAEA